MCVPKTLPSFFPHSPCFPVNRFAGTRLEELKGEIPQLCKDQHGCRYLQKKLEESVPEHRDMIFRETFGHFADLMTGMCMPVFSSANAHIFFVLDPFGNYLCQKLLEYSTDEQRNVICESVASDLVTISLNMHGTRAVQKMIDFLSTQRQASTPFPNPQHCAYWPGTALRITIKQADLRYDAQIHAIIVALSLHVVTLIKDLNGNHVIQKCLNKLAPDDNQVSSYIVSCNMLTNSFPSSYTTLSLPTVLKLPRTAMVAASYNAALTMPPISKGSSWYKRSLIMR